MTPFDIEAATARLVAECGYEDIAAWADYFLHARATDTEVLEFFRSRDPSE